MTSCTRVPRVCCLWRWSGRGVCRHSWPSRSVIRPSYWRSRGESSSSWGPASGHFLQNAVCLIHLMKVAVTSLWCNVGTAVRWHKISREQRERGGGGGTGERSLQGGNGEGCVISLLWPILLLLSLSIVFNFPLYLFTYLLMYLFRYLFILLLGAGACPMPHIQATVAYLSDAHWAYFVFPLFERSIKRVTCHTFQVTSSARSHLSMIKRHSGNLMEIMWLLL